MKLQQLSVFLEDRVGRLTAPCDALAERGINIATLSLADTERFGILRLMTREWQRAMKVLQGRGWAVSLAEVLAVAIEDRPGGLAEVLKQVERAGLSIEYMYPMTYRRNDHPIMVMRFVDPDAAEAQLQQAGLQLVGDVELYDH
jgi:hypothetical protein